MEKYLLKQINTTIMNLIKSNGNKFIFLFLLSLIGHYNLFSQENKTIDCKNIVLEGDSLFAEFNFFWESLFIISL